MRQRKQPEDRRLLPTLLLLTISATTFAADPVPIGSTRQLFVDAMLVGSLKGVRRVLHSPRRAEIAIAVEHPWEEFGVSYMTVFRDGNRFRAWYRVDGKALSDRRSMTAYAESSDGIRWTKPTLGLIEFNGSNKNNLVWTGPGVNMSVFKDGNPAAPDSERYKAIVRTGDVLALVSPDGLRWRLVQDEPILTDRPFDSHNIAYWDAHRGHYVAYTRGVARGERLGAGASSSFGKGVRGIRRATSKDFRNWSKLELIDLGDTPLEHLYTNSAVPYDRSPGLVLMFPSRFVNTRRSNPARKEIGVNDIVFMSSRDGLKFDRSFMEAFLRPGRDPRVWNDRALYLERGILQTSPTELSLFAMHHWRLPSVHIRRLVLRVDGFVSVRAPYAGGELVTRPLMFDGRRLRVNYATSAAGSIRVEIQDAGGNPIDGFSLADCPEIYGDTIDGLIRWKAGDDVSRLAGRPVRLRFVMKDADLYAFRFGDK